MSAVARNRGRAAAMLLAVFLAGAAAGAAGFSLGQRAFRHEAPRGRAMERLSRELSLDPGQRKQIELILDRQRRRMRPLLEETRREIRAVLRPDQQARFDTMPRPGRRRGEGRKWMKSSSFVP